MQLHCASVDSKQNELLVPPRSFGPPVPTEHFTGPQPDSIAKGSCCLEHAITV